MNLLRIFRHSWGPVTVALLLVVIEKTAWIFEPNLFGKVIDAMIDAASDATPNSPVTPLLVWIGVFAFNSIVGLIRRTRDERIYLSIYADIAAGISKSGADRGEPTPKTAARAELSREYISFFQYRIPEIIEQGIDIVGATIALAFFDWRLAVACMGVLLPMTLAWRISGKRILRLQARLHDQREDVYEIFATRDHNTVRAYYQEQAKSQQKIANWGALNFGVFRLFLLGIFVVILYIAIDFDGFSTGSIYSIAAYVWTFVTSSEYVPELWESWTSLKELSQRFSVGENTASEPPSMA